MPSRRKRTLQDIVGANVRRLRKSAGATQEALAAKIGISGVYLSQIENASANCSLQILEAIAAALNVAPVELVKPGRVS